MTNTTSQKKDKTTICSKISKK